MSYKKLTLVGLATLIVIGLSGCEMEAANETEELAEGIDIEATHEDDSFDETKWAAYVVKETGDIQGIMTCKEWWSSESINISDEETNELRENLSEANSLIDRILDVEAGEVVMNMNQCLEGDFTLATVTHIVDGDTIDVNIDGVTERVRLIGIDTPERGETGFNEATDFTREAIESVGNVVWLQAEGNDRDRYHRIRRYVWLGIPDPENRSETLLNQMLLDVGHAVEFIVGSPKSDRSFRLDHEEAQTIGESGREYFYGIPLIPEAPTHFQNCTAVREWYPDGLPYNHPAFRSAHDRNNDGWGCE